MKTYEELAAKRAAWYASTEDKERNPYIEGAYDAVTDVMADDLTPDDIRTARESLIIDYDELRGDPDADTIDIDYLHGMIDGYGFALGLPEYAPEGDAE